MAESAAPALRKPGLDSKLTRRILIVGGFLAALVAVIASVQAGIQGSGKVLKEVLVDT